MFYQVIILTSRGNELLLKKYREDGVPDLGHFFRMHLKEKAADDELLPVMQVHGKCVIHIKCNGLHFICSCSQDEPPFAAFELLERLCGLVKDFCGVVSEEAIVENTALVYELLEEVMDYGIIQSTSTRSLKPYIQTEAITVKQDRQIEGILGLGPGLFGSDFQIAPKNSPDKPLSLNQQSRALGSQKNEVFVDIIERLTVLVSHNGSVIQSDLNGSIHLRSFLIGNPELVIGLSEDLVIGKGSPVSSGPGLRLDYAKFHPSIDMSDFQQQRVINIQPHEGETNLMTYSISGTHPKNLPFKLSATMTEVPEKQVVDVVLHLACVIEEKYHAANISVILPLPKSTTDVAPSLQSQSQSVEFKRGDKVATWGIKKMMGSTQFQAKLRIHVDQLSASTFIEIGPASLEFELKDFTASGMQVRYLKVFDRHNSYVPFRWVRCATLSDSYVVRLR